MAEILVALAARGRSLQARATSAIVPDIHGFKEEISPQGTEKERNRIFSMKARVEIRDL